MKTFILITLALLEITLHRPITFTSNDVFSVILIKIFRLILPRHLKYRKKKFIDENKLTYCLNVHKHHSPAFFYHLKHSENKCKFTRAPALHVIDYISTCKTVTLCSHKMLPQANQVRFTIIRLIPL